MENDINASLDKWSGVFLTAVDQHIPKNKARNVNEHPWIDHELLQSIKAKNELRAAVIKSGSTDDQNKLKQIRCEVKALIFSITLNAFALSSIYDKTKSRP